MQELANTIGRLTTTDVVFEKLHQEIVNLELLPGAKLSEVAVAKRFGVSRQPVREAFNRLSGMDLLLVRPQKATKVYGFSLQHIAKARFVRLALELEVLRRACAVWDKDRAAELAKNLGKQRDCVENNRPEDLRALDYEFHELICVLGDCPLAFETIKEQKNKVDRLCVLAFDQKAKESATILSDHQAIADALEKKSVEEVTDATRIHLSRLDETIALVEQNHPDYFREDIS